jgi:ABC-type phosphate transport system permease subunit
MSIETIPKSAPGAGDGVEPTRKERRRAGKAKPGISMLAQGEPMVWLSGGALAMCLVMILGLLGLCLFYGMGTFWPTPIYRIELVDGTVHEGQVTRYEEFSLGRQMANRLEGEVKEAALNALGNEDSVVARRWLLRTGNYELTDEHFNWVSDLEMAALPEGIQEPEWALMLERVEWGRFYGTPHEFAYRTERTPGEEEQELKEIVQFLDSQRYQLFSDPDDTKVTQFDEAVKPLREKLDQVRQDNIVRFLGEFTAAEGKRFDLVFEGGARESDVDLSQFGVQPGQDVIEVEEVWAGAAEAWRKYNEMHAEVRERYYERRRLEKHDIGAVNAVLESARLGVRQAEIDHDVYLLSTAEDIKLANQELQALEDEREKTRAVLKKIRERMGEDAPLTGFAEQMAEGWLKKIDERAAEPEERKKGYKTLIAETPDDAQGAVVRFLEASETANEQTVEIQAEINSIKGQNERPQLRMVTAQGQGQTIALGNIVRAVPANQLSLGGKVSVYLSRWWEFLADEPREANSEGGVFPAIWGTVVMTLIMSLAVVPFGVLAALYLREYAKAGPVVSAVRIAINNLAGVPSIVFGVFGLGFFCYIIGAFIDGGPAKIPLTPMPQPIWYAVAFGLAALGSGAFLTGVYSLAARTRERTQVQVLLGYLSVLLWLTCFVVLIALIFWTPMFRGFFRPSLPNPTFGKGGLIWASLTLALLTLPVVIVATEEALSAVPNSLREGSYACGGSKWQTIKRIVLPHAMPGIMTGMILAMARGAGEVAPLMLVGAVKLAPELPLDLSFPFLHPDRSFMHLGFHIFDLGFHSPNSEAAKPMVFTTTLLLIGIIAVLNLAAVWLRARLRKRFQGGEF